VIITTRHPAARHACTAGLVAGLGQDRTRVDGCTRHGDHAQPFGGPAVGLRGQRREALAVIEATREHCFRRALHCDDDARLVRHLVLMRHLPALAHERPAGHDSFANQQPIDRRPRGLRRQQLEDGAVHRLDALGHAGQRGRLQQRSHRDGQLITRRELHAERTVVKRCDDHVVARERACLVDAQHGRRAQRLDRLRLARQHLGLREAPGAEREHHGPDDRELFRHDGHRKRQPDQQARCPRPVAPGEDGRRHEAGEQRDDRDDPHELRQLALQAAGARRLLGHAAADAAERGACAGLGDDRDRVTLDHQRAGMQPCGGLVGGRRGDLVDRDRFAGEQRFVDAYRMGLDDLRVAGEAVALLHDQAITGHEFAARDALDHAAPHNAAARARQVAQRLQYALRPGLLPDRDACDHQHRDAEHGAVEAAAQQRVERGAGEQQQNHRLHCHREQHRKRRLVLRRRQAVRAEVLQARARLGRRQSRRGARLHRGGQRINSIGTLLRASTVLATEPSTTLPSAP
jgi:hypothetical protein